MTAQIEDKFEYRNSTYSVAGISEGGLFDPASLDLEPSMNCSACWRGYYVIYSLVANHLVVADLHINLRKRGFMGFKRLAGPPINGVHPTGPKTKVQLFNNHYEGVNYHLEYSGGVLLADGFIDDLLVNMGFQAPWRYTDVIELVFRNGMLENEFDRSEQMAEIRDIITNPKNKVSGTMPTDEEIRRFVEDAFDRTYRL